jgi:hypothetical protein
MVELQQNEYGLLQESIIMRKNTGTRETSVKQVASRAERATYFMLVSSLAYTLTLKMEAMFSSKTSVDFQRTIRHYIPKDRNFHVEWCLVKSSLT